MLLYSIIRTENTFNFAIYVLKFFFKKSKTNKNPKSKPQKPQQQQTP